MIIGVPVRPARWPMSYCIDTVFLQSRACIGRSFLASVRAFLRSGAHHTEIIFLWSGLPMPMRGKAMYCTAIPCLLYSAISLWNLRQYAHSTSVKIATVYFGFGGEKTMRS